MYCVLSTGKAKRAIDASHSQSRRKIDPLCSIPHITALLKWCAGDREMAKPPKTTARPLLPGSPICVFGTAPRVKHLLVKQSVHLRGGALQSDGRSSAFCAEKTELLIRHSDVIRVRIDVRRRAKARSIPVSNREKNTLFLKELHHLRSRVSFQTG